MAFDQGKYTVLVDGVPFRADGATYADAHQSIVDTLTENPDLFDARTKQLGLNQNDLDALKIRFDNTKQGYPNSGDAALRGLVQDPEKVAGSGLNKFLIGAGHTFVDQYRGARQTAAQIIGDKESVDAFAALQKNEDDTFAQLDDKGIGAEDIGQLAPEFLEFMLPGAAGAKGLIPLAVAGAAMGAADVQQDPTLASRSLATGAGAAGALVGPVLGKAVGLAQRTASSVAGLSYRLPGGLVRLYQRGWRGKPGALMNTVAQALNLAGPDEKDGMQILGRAALDKATEVIRSLPGTEAAGLKDEATMGAVRAALSKATVETYPGSGTNVFNPAIWEKEMAANTGKIGRMFKKNDPGMALASLNVLAREMQNLPNEVSPQAAEAAAAALVAAPHRAAPILAALKVASKKEVRQSLFNTLVDITQSPWTMAQNVAGAGVAAALPTVGEQGSDKIADYAGRKVERAFQP